jgi:hypothetical protein
MFFDDNSECPEKFLIETNNEGFNCWGVDIKPLKLNTPMPGFFSRGYNGKVRLLDVQIKQEYYRIGLKDEEGDNYLWYHMYKFPSI